MNSLFHTSRSIGFALLCVSGAIARAGAPVVESKEVKEVAPPAADDWQFTLAVPGWLAATSGTIGLNGVNSHVYMGFDTLLKHLDMTASLSAEVRKGRFGIYGDFLYVKASESVYPDGLIGKADVRLDQWLANLEVNYRVLEGPKGYLDLRAGVRYTSLYSKLAISPNDSAIEAASAKLVDDIGEKVRARLSELDLKTKLRTVLEDRIRARVTGRLEDLQSNRPILPIPPLDGNRPGLIEDAIRAAINRRLDDLAAALRAKAAAATPLLQAAAQARIDALKKRIADKIASALKDKLNNSASLQKQWVDPYVGIAARYNLSKAWYLTGKADIGGFGIGSEITWQGSCALGCQITRSIFAEAGYRYLYTDYNQGGFLYDVSQSGAQLTVGITF